jgi:hypothetical protein
MKQKIGFSFIALFIAATFFSGCSKKDIDIPDISAKQVEPGAGTHLRMASRTDNWQAAANPENPLDNVGLLHNQVLSNILNDVEYGNLSNAEAVYGSETVYADRNFGSDAVSRFQAVFPQDRLANFCSSLGSDRPSVDFMVDLTGLSSSGKDYLRPLIEDLYGHPSNTDYDFLKNKIMVWESQIASQNFSDEDANGLYAFGSTLRYSLLAWQAAEFPDTNAGHVQMRLRLFGWIATAIFDGVGGALGTIGGGPIVGALAGGGMSAGCAFICNHYDW